MSGQGSNLGPGPPHSVVWGATDHTVNSVLRIRIRGIISLDPDQMIRIRIQQKPLKTENNLVF